MNNIFNFTNKDELYKKCLYASIAHAVMIGKYYLLSDEISWDGNNYLFQNMEGVRGVFAFSDRGVVAAVQNSERYIEGVSAIFDKLAERGNNELSQMIEKEIVPYFFVDDSGSVPGITSLFWSHNDSFLSCMSEEDVMKSTDNILLPYLYEFDDLKKYWRDYYETDKEQMNFIDYLFEKRLLSDNFSLGEDAKKLESWFGEKSILCKTALKEIGIGS